MYYRLRTVLILMAFCLHFSGCWGITTTPKRAMGRRFDSDVWRRADPNKENDREIRGSMVDDLIDRKLLDGLTAKETEELLGPPLSAEDRKMAGMADVQGELCYHLGPTRDVPIDEEFLMIRLDQAGRVVEYHVTPN